MSGKTMDIDTRVNISLAVNRYLRALDRFEQASKDFNEACSAVRTTVEKETTFIVKDSYKHYLVTMDGERNFEVKEIDFV